MIRLHAKNFSSQTPIYSFTSLDSYKLKDAMLFCRIDGLLSLTHLLRWMFLMP